MSFKIIDKFVRFEPDRPSGGLLNHAAMLGPFQIVWHSLLEIVEIVSGHILSGNFDRYYQYYFIKHMHTYRKKMYYTSNIFIMSHPRIQKNNYFCM